MYSAYSLRSEYCYGEEYSVKHFLKYSFPPNGWIVFYQPWKINLKNILANSCLLTCKCMIKMYFTTEITLIYYP